MLGAALPAAAGSAPAQPDVAAYVWPAYQPDPRWAELGIFGAGKGEWQNVWEAVPKWKGHRQPLVPAWGYEDESDPNVVERKIDAAVSHGVNVFIYDWYWYGGRPFLENGLNKGFLGAKNSGRMKFFVMWANHHVTWLWDNKVADKRGKTPRKGWLGFVTDEEFRTKLVPRWIAQYFTRPNYYRIGGKPVLMIYEIGTFVKGVGGVEAASAAIAYLRAEAAKAGLGGVHLMACDYGLKPEWVKALGIDSATIYNFIHWAHAGGNPDYADWAKKGAARFDAARRELGLAAYFPHVSVGWDTNPRFPAGSVQATVLGSTPAKFEVALRRAKDWGEANVPKGVPRLITVNSWNEWTEGSYLEPDTVHGSAYLDAIRRVVSVACSAPVPAVAADHAPQLSFRDDSGKPFVIRNPVWPQDAPDPTVWRDDAGRFYLASTHQDILASDDLLTWKKTGKKLLDATEYAEIAKTWPHVWAPAVKRIGDWYVLYLCFHNTGAHTAVVSYRSKSPTGPFRERNVLVTSEGDGKFEVIDPDVAFEDGRAFLFFGHGDVRRVELTPDGRSRKPGAPIEHVAGLALGRKPSSGLNGWKANATEGSYLYRRNGWWYLFVSEGNWCDHTYRVSVGRARRLADAFFDRDGRPMAEAAATVILSSVKGDVFYGPGHNGEIVERNGRTYMFYHCHWTGCEPMKDGVSNVQVGSRYIPRVLLLQEVFWDAEGWPFFGNGGKPEENAVATDKE